MNQDEIIRMAKESSGDDWEIFRDFMPEIKRFAALVALNEREACAQEAEAEASVEGIAQRIAARIRARGQL